MLSIHLMLFPQAVLAERFSGSIEKKDFKYTTSQKVKIDPNESLFMVEVDPHLAESMQQSAQDLRLFSGDYELSYSIFYSDTQTHSTNIKNVTVLNEGETQDGKYSFVTQLPQDDYKSSKLVIKLNQDHYLLKGTLSGSSDNRTWQKLRSVTLFGIQQKYSEISLEAIDYEYLKFELDPHGESYQVIEANLHTPAVNQTQDQTTWQEPTFEHIKNDRESHVIIDLGYQNRISSEWKLEVADQGFYREAVVEGSQNKTDWQYIGSTYLYKGVNQKDENLSFQYPSQAYRYVRITIINQDNEPLDIQSAKVRLQPLRLIVKSPPNIESGEMEIKAYWGNEQIAAPSYDVGQITDQLDVTKLSQVTLNEQLTNPDFQEKEVPFTEKYPFTLPLALAFTSLFVGYLLYRNLKQLKST